MALFARRGSDDDRIARDLAAAIAKRENLEARLATAEAEVTGSRANVDKLARDAADDGELDEALSRKRKAEDKASALTVALGAARQVVADLEAKAAAIADKKLRGETSTAIERIAVELQSAGKNFEEAASRLTDAARRASDITPDSHALTAYAMSAATEVAPAVSMIGDVLRHQAALVLNGTAKAALPMPEKVAPRPQLVRSTPELERVFAMRHLKYTDANGELRRFPKMNPADLPPEHARRALANAWAIAINDQRVKGLAGIYGQQIPDDHWCSDVGTGEAAALPLTDVGAPGRTIAPPIKHSAFGAFEPLPGVGKPYTIKVATQPLEPMPMAASRTMPGDES